VEEEEEEEEEGLFKADRRRRRTTARLVRTTRRTKALRAAATNGKPPFPSMREKVGEVEVDEKIATVTIEHDSYREHDSGW
jgi:hypothetical protein